MIRIGLLSDTHGYLHPGVFSFFKEVDEIWHAGDIGALETADQLRKFKPLVGVYGNIDGHMLRQIFPEYVQKEVHGLRILMMHIGGYPGRYSPLASRLIRESRPGMFISGHSHILKVVPDPKNNLLHINPGAAGYQGIHQKITMVRFSISEGKPQKMEVYEADRKKI